MKIPMMIRAVFLSLLVFPCSGAVTLAFRLVVPCGSTNASSPMTLEGNASPRFCLDQTTIVDETGVKSAVVQMVSPPGKPQVPMVMLTLTEEASKRMLEATTKNIGQQFAVVLNGRLIDVPVAKAPISNVIALVGRFTQPQANDIAAEFNRQTPASKK